MNKQEKQGAIEWIDNKCNPRLHKDNIIRNDLLALVEREPTWTLEEIEDVIYDSFFTINAVKKAQERVRDELEQKLTEKEKK